MRDFAQRKAEVFRRSEEQIKKRRKARTRLLLCTLPAALICLLLLVPALMPAFNGAAPEMKPAFSDAEMSFSGNAIGGGDGAVNPDPSALAVTLELSSGDRRTLDDPASVAAIADFLRILPYEPEIVPETAPPPTGDPSGEVTLRLTMIFPDGSGADYTLTDNILQNAATCQQWRLDSPRLSALMTLLGFSE